MKGVVRSIDPLGRLVIPKEIRDKLGFSPGEPVQMSVSGNTVVVEKYKEACLICGTTTDLFQINGKNVCLSCAAKIAKDMPKK
jgi:transcriptional pleiotropic regulator of transition state genes